MIYQEKYIIGVIAWVFASLKDKSKFNNKHIVSQCCIVEQRKFMRRYMASFASFQTIFASQGWLYQDPRSDYNFLASKDAFYQPA